MNKPKPLRWKSREAKVLLESLDLDWRPVNLPPTIVRLAELVLELRERVEALEAKKK